MEQIKECVVYKITNIVNSRIYIGVSTNYNKRMEYHKHTPNKKIQKDIEDFSFTFDGDFEKEIIFQGTIEECYSLESKLVPKNKNKRPYYNTLPGGFGGHGLEGEDHPFASLSNKEATEVKYLCDYGYKQNYIAKLYNVSNTVINGIVTGKHYIHVKGPIHNPDTKGENNHKAKLKEQEVLDICKRGIAGEDKNLLAKEYNIDVTQVYNIITGKQWKYLKRETLEVKKDFKGENHPLHKITEKDVVNICVEVVNNNKSIKDMMIKYNLSTTHIRDIVTKNSWKDVDRPYRDRMSKEDMHGEKHPNAIITKEMVIEMRNIAYTTKDTLVKMEKKYPCSSSNIGKIIRGIAWDKAPGPILGKDYMKRGEGAL